MLWLAEKYHEALTKEVDDICSKQPKPLKQIKQKDVRAALQELIDLRRQRLNSPGAVLPATFRGIIPPSNQEVIVDVKDVGKCYLTIQNECSRQLLPTGEGEELFFTILEHMKPRIGLSDMVWEKVVPRNKE